MNPDTDNGIQANTKSSANTSFNMRSSDIYNTNSNRSMIAKEYAYIKSTRAPFKSGKLCKVYEKWIRHFNFIFIQKIMYTYYYCWYKLIACAVIVMNSSLMYYLHHSIGQVAWLLIGMFGAIVIVSNTCHIILKIKKRACHLFESDDLLITCFIAQIAVFLICIAIYAYHSIMAFRLDSRMLLLLGLCFEFPESVYLLWICGLCLAIIICHTIEFIYRMLLCRMRLSLEKHGKERVKITIYQLDANEITPVCIICQNEIGPTDKLCYLCCECKAGYHRDCIVSWYELNHFCPLCMKYANIK